MREADLTAAADRALEAVRHADWAGATSATVAAADLRLLVAAARLVPHPAARRRRRLFRVDL